MTHHHQCDSRPPIPNTYFFKKGSENIDGRTPLPTMGGRITSSCSLEVALSNGIDTDVHNPMTRNHDRPWRHCAARDCSCSPASVRRSPRPCLKALLLGRVLCVHLWVGLHHCRDAHLQVGTASAPVRVATLPLCPLAFLLVVCAFFFRS